MDQTQQYSREEIEGHIKDLFTIQERAMMSDLIQKSEFDHVAAVVEVDDQDHAFWLEQYLDLYRAKAMPAFSKVEEEIRVYEGDGNAIDTPAKSAFFSERVEAERRGEKLPPLDEALAAFLKKNEDMEAEEEDTEEETTESLKKPEIIAILEERGIEHDKTAKKAELLELLNSSDAARVESGEPLEVDADEAVNE